MKKIIILIISLFFALNIFSQSFSILTPDEQGYAPISNNDTIVISADSASQITYNFIGYIENNTSSTINVHIEIEKIYVSEGNLIQLCFNDFCHNTLYCTENVDASSLSELHISLYYTADDTLSNIIKVTITDIDSKSDTAVFYVKYKPLNTTANTSIGITKNYFSKPYPNPADNYVKFSYNIKEISQANLTIYSILGKKVYYRTLNNREETISINTSKYKTGYYIYVIEVDNKKIITDRFLIKH